MVPVTRETLVDGVADLTERFVDLTGSAITPEENFVAGTPGWTVHDVVAHMATVVPRYAQGPRGGGDWVDDPTDLAALNEQLLQEVNGVPLPSLIEQIRSDVADTLGRRWPVTVDEVLAWGRRPWLALSLPGRFHDP